MRRKATWFLIGSFVLLVVAVALGGGDLLWHWLLAMHGKH
jgi:hypothetical protein